VLALNPFRLANQRILELESQVEELQEGGGGVGMRQRLADLQGQLRIVQGEKERRVSQLEEREVSIAECSMYGLRNLTYLIIVIRIFRETFSYLLQVISFT
jgi:hypothetical protein